MMNWFLNIIKKNKPQEVVPMKKFLIVGLGNIGSEYANTRHNIGFKILDYVANAEGISFQTQKLGDVAELKIKGRTLLLLKPNTYMNLSGKAVQYYMQHYKISLENILVVTDDLALEVGTIRLRLKGSHGGHNGLRNIEEVLQTQQYPRLRFGIGSQFDKHRQVDFVLGKWDKKEVPIIQQKILDSISIIESFATQGIAKTMSDYNK
jgi:PTH1 family peptidyl-tRNA hydrolase